MKLMPCLPGREAQPWLLLVIAMEFDGITISRPGFLSGHTFGPVTLEHNWEGPIDLHHELPVMMTPHSRRFLGIRWYPEVCHTRGVFAVAGDRIILRPTAPIVFTRAAWWRCLGYLLFIRGTRTHSVNARPRSPAER